MARSCGALAAVTLALAGACVPGPWQQQERQPEIAIATLAPSSGPDVETIEGADFALKSNPTVRVYRLRRAAFDDAVAGMYDPAKGLQNLKQVIADPAILGIIEPSASAEVMNSLSLTGKADLALVSPATDGCLTVALPACSLPPPPHPGSPSSFFRVAMRDDMQARAMARYARERLGLRAAAVITENGGYGNELVEGFSQEFTALGRTVVQRDTFNSDETDFAPLLHRLRESSPEALYVGGTTVGHTCTIRAQMQAIFASDLYFLGAEGILDDRCLHDAGRNLGERMIATTPAPQIRASPEAAAVVNAYRKVYPRAQEVGGWNFAGYDCGMILIDAIGRAIDANGGRIPNRAQVRQAVAQTKGLRGVTGVWSFDQNGDASNPTAAIYNVRDARWVHLTDISVKQ